ncbi:SMP-30/Gluconolaconase/LRE-like region [compost metagenome]
MYSSQIQPDGKQAFKQRFGWLHVLDTDDNAGAGNIICDREGRIYVATNMGVQILDQTGRVNAILPSPAGAAAKIVFGGSDFDTLYITKKGKTYSRKLKTRGINAGDAPNKPDAPRL